MSDNLPQSYSEQFRADDEIDLLELIKILWEGKWTIVGTTGFVTSIALVVLISVPSSFDATTKIKPISAFAADAYAESNALGFFVVDRSALLASFVGRLDDRELFVEATKALSLINRDDFEAEALYEEEVLAFVESLRLLPPLNEDGLERGVSRRNWELVAEYDDQDKWLEALRYVERRANAEISALIRQRFATKVLVTERSEAFRLLDLGTSIDNALEDYNRDTADRLAFLREQADIARELGVAKNTIEAQTFSAQTSILASIETDTPFYLRGYEAIEKEMQLIKSREDKQAFVKGLVTLEREKRAVEQDLTVERAKVLFESTPAWTGEGFEASAFTPEGTTYDAKTSKLLILVLTGLLSGMLSCIYVLVASVMRKSATSDS
jgi:LPS O-antigen subunit length determinant protein (WzzB/FepE family)